MRPLLHRSLRAMHAAERRPAQSMMMRRLTSTVTEPAVTSSPVLAADVPPAVATEEIALVKRANSKVVRASLRANKTSTKSSEGKTRELKDAVSVTSDAAVSAVENSPTTTTTTTKTDDASSLETYGLPPAILAAFRANFPNVASLFPVQVSALEAFRSGKDVVVRSQTGTGKTLAFAIPALEKLLSSGREMRARSGEMRDGAAPSILVMAPTRELANQISDEFLRFELKGVKIVPVYGGTPIGPQIARLRGADVVVGTPGRIMDLMARGKLSMENVKIAVLDEADEMLRVGFLEAMREIYAAMPQGKDRQNMLFSATIPAEIRSIMDDFLNKDDMLFVDMLESQAKDRTKIPKTVTLVAMPLASRPSEAKEQGLRAVLRDYFAPSSRGDSSSGEGGRTNRALVFVSRKADCDDLSGKIPGSGALHGDMAQAAREKTLAEFKAGKVMQVLIATDVAARGLDIPEVDLVVHYDIPREGESFVHRTGRTGRANREGTNVILYDPRGEERDVRELERFVGAKFQRRQIPSGENVMRRRVDVMVERLLSRRGNESAAAAVRTGAITGSNTAFGKYLREISARVLAGMEPIEAVSGILDLAAHGEDGGQRETFSALTGRLGMATVRIAIAALDDGKVVLPQEAGRPARLKHDKEHVLIDVPASVVEEMLAQPGVERLANEEEVPEIYVSSSSSSSSFSSSSSSRGYGRGNGRSGGRSYGGGYGGGRGRTSRSDSSSYFEGNNRRGSGRDRSSYDGSSSSYSNESGRSRQQRGSYENDNSRGDSGYDRKKKRR